MDEIVRQYFDWDQARPYLPDLLRGFWVTIQIAVLAEVLCLALGLVLAVARQAGTGAGDRKSTRLNSSHGMSSRMPSSA